MSLMSPPSYPPAPCLFIEVRRTKRKKEGGGEKHKGRKGKMLMNCLRRRRSEEPQNFISHLKTWHLIKVA